MSQHSNSSDDEDGDVSPLEYTRANGLSRNYLVDSSSFVEMEKLRHLVDRDVANDSHLPQFDFGPNVSIDERISMPHDATSLLASVAHEDNVEEIDALVLSMLPNVRKLKIEPPLLRSDHQQDCREFGHREKFEIKLKDVKLPLEMVNEENGEGLAWPPSYRTLGATVMEELKNERICVSKDTMSYLSTFLMAAWTVEDENKMWDVENSYKRVGLPFNYISLFQD